MKSLREVLGKGHRYIFRKVVLNKMSAVVCRRLSTHTRAGFQRLSHVLWDHPAGLYTCDRVPWNPPAQGLEVTGTFSSHATAWGRLEGGDTVWRNVWGPGVMGQDGSLLGQVAAGWPQGSHLTSLRLIPLLQKRQVWGRHHPF